MCAWLIMEKEKKQKTREFAIKSETFRGMKNDDILLNLQKSKGLLTARLHS